MNNRLFTWILIISIAILAQGCGKLPSEESCNFVQNSQGRRVSWFRMPIQFYVDAGISGDQLQAIQEAMDVWNKVFDRPVFEIINQTADLPPPQLDENGRVIADGFNGIYIVSREAFANNAVKDEQGKTSLSFRGDFIFEADILLDGSESFFIGDVTESSARRRVEFKSLMIHELGHVLGLDHIEGADQPVMSAQLQYGQVRHQVTQQEVDSLACEY